MSPVTMLIIGTLIALNGLFVAAEFAIVGAPKAAIDRLARKGSRAARAVQAVLENPRRQDRFIATAQLGITLASLGLGMYGEHLLAEWLAGHLDRLGAGRWVAAHSVASAAAVMVLTYFHIVLGEMVPKSVALQEAQRTVLWVVPLMRAIQLAMYPLVLLLNGIGNGLLRVMGIRRDVPSHEHYRTAEELAYLVRETAAGGLLRGESARVVQELFEFSGLTAGAVMVPRVRVVGLPLGAQRAAIQAVLAGQPHTRYPVYDGTLERIVGMLHVKDLLRCLSTADALTPDRVRPVTFVPPTAAMDCVLAAMKQAGSQLAVVLDEHGGTAGIVTVEDLFEEVVGEFGEDTGSQPELHTDADGRLHAGGTLRPEKLGAALGVVLKHEDVDTVGGLVLTLLGRPPAVGDVVVYDDVRLEVVMVEGHGVREVVATRQDLPGRAS
jgi:CBS domain containing-hemolysin-like protein